MKSFKEWYLLNEEINNPLENFRLTDDEVEKYKEKIVNILDNDGIIDDDITELIKKCVFYNSINTKRFKNASTGLQDSVKSFIEYYNNDKNHQDFQDFQDFLSNIQTLTRKIFAKNVKQFAKIETGGMNKNSILDGVIKEVDEKVKNYNKSEDKSKIENEIEDKSKIENEIEDKSKIENEIEDKSKIENDKQNENNSTTIDYDLLDKAIHTYAIGKNGSKDFKEVLNKIADKTKSKIESYFAEAESRNNDYNKYVKKNPVEVKEELWNNVKILMEKQHFSDYETTSFRGANSSYSDKGLKDSTNAKKHYIDELGNLIELYIDKADKLFSKLSNFKKSENYLSEIKYKIRSLVYEFARECSQLSIKASKDIKKDGLLINKIGEHKVERAKAKETKEEAYRNSERGQAEASYINDQKEYYKEKIKNACTEKDSDSPVIKIQKKLLRSFIVNNGNNYSRIYDGFKRQPMYANLLAKAGVSLPKDTDKYVNKFNNSNDENEEQETEQSSVYTEGFGDALNNFRMKNKAKSNAKDKSEGTAIRSAVLELSKELSDVYKDTKVIIAIAKLISDKNFTPDDSFINNEDYKKAVELVNPNYEDSKEENEDSKEENENSKEENLTDFEKEFINDLIKNNIIKNIINGTYKMINTSVFTEEETEENVIEKSIRNYLFANYSKRLKECGDIDKFIQNVINSKEIKNLISKEEKNKNNISKENSKKNEFITKETESMFNYLKQNHIVLRSTEGKEAIKNKIFVDIKNNSPEFLKYSDEIYKTVETNLLEKGIKTLTSVTTAKCDGLPIGARKYARAVRRRMNYALNKYL